jgi:predicted DNA-binding transcriptional regulator YafY
MLLIHSDELLNPLPEAKEKEKTPSLLDRHERLIKITALLEGGGPWNVRQLASYFGVARRTIYRDLQLLRHANFSIVFDKALRAFRIDTYPTLAADELMALVVAIKQTGPLPESIADACDRALKKVLASAPPEVNQHAVETYERLTPPTMAANRLPLQALVG